MPYLVWDFDGTLATRDGGGSGTLCAEAWWRALKPNPAAFERVFADFPAARGGWMIGDNPVADVAGGEAVGLRAILVRGEHPAARRRCGSLLEVADIVGRPPR